MNPIRDNDLILFHYRDGLDAGRMAQVEAALGADPDLRVRYASLQRMLGAVDTVPPVDVDADFAARVWRRLEQRIENAAPARAVPLRDDAWRPKFLGIAYLSAPAVADLLARGSMPGEFDQALDWGTLDAGRGKPRDDGDQGPDVDAAQPRSLSRPALPRSPRPASPCSPDRAGR